MRPPLRTSGERLHRVTLETPGTPAPDGSGGYTESWQPIAGPLFARIAPAVAADLERLAASTVVAVATHVITIPYVPGVTTTARVVFGARHFSIAGVSDIEERQIQLILLCVELEASAAASSLRMTL